MKKQSPNQSLVIMLLSATAVFFTVIFFTSKPANERQRRSDSKLLSDFANPKISSSSTDQSSNANHRKVDAISPAQLNPSPEASRLTKENSERERATLRQRSDESNALGADRNQISTSGTIDVVGRKIPVSDSIESVCRGTVNNAFSESCEVVQQMLSRMSNEHRDERWASDTEAKIRACILADMPNSHFRTLECRSSLCAVEMVSPSATAFKPVFAEKDREICGVNDWANFIVASETDASKSIVTVYLRVFERR